MRGRALRRSCYLTGYWLGIHAVAVRHDSPYTDPSWTDDDYRRGFKDGARWALAHVEQVWI